MKKFILLLLIASIGAAACKKEKKSATRVDKPIAEAILGVWITTSGSHEYFNANNEKVFTQTVEPDWNYSINEVFKIENPQAQRLLRTEYSVTSSNGKNFFSFTNNGVTEKYEITSLEQETMTWRQEKTNVTYEDNGTKTAARLVTTINFHCPCK